MARATKPKAVRPIARVGDAELVEKRRAQIVEAATRLVSRNGFGKTVVRDIAIEADFSVGLVYEYVRSKEDILFLVYEYWSDVWNRGLIEAVSGDGSPLDRLAAGVRFLVEAADEHPDVTHLFYREAGNLTEEAREWTKSAERAYVATLSDLISEGMSAGLLRRDTDPLALGAALVLLSHGWALKGYLLHPRQKPAEYAEWVAAVCVRGAATPAGLQQLDRR